MKFFRKAKHSLSHSVKRRLLRCECLEERAMLTAYVSNGAALAAAINNGENVYLLNDITLNSYAVAPNNIIIDSYPGEDEVLQPSEIRTITYGTSAGIGFDLDGGSYGDDVTVKNVNIAAGGNVALGFTGSGTSDVIIDNCNISATGLGAGIVITSDADILNFTITDSEFSGGSVGIHCRGDVANFTIGDDETSDDIEIHDTGTGIDVVVDDFDVHMAFRVRNARIYDNTCGIDIYATGDDSLLRGVIGIIDCNIFDNDTYGISIKATNGGHINNATAIIGCTIQNNHKTGILMSAGPGSIFESSNGGDMNVIKGNSISQNAEYGILLQASNTGTLREISILPDTERGGNIFSDNGIAGVGTSTDPDTPSYGIYFIVITGNTFTNTDNFEASQDYKGHIYASTEYSHVEVEGNEFLNAPVNSQPIELDDTTEIMKAPVIDVDSIVDSGTNWEIPVSVYQDDTNFANLACRFEVYAVVFSDDSYSYTPIYVTSSYTLDGNGELDATISLSQSLLSAGQGIAVSLIMEGNSTGYYIRVGDTSELSTEDLTVPKVTEIKVGHISSWDATDVVYDRDYTFFQNGDDQSDTVPCAGVNAVTITFNRQGMMGSGTEFDSSATSYSLVATNNYNNGGNKTISAVSNWVYDPGDNTSTCTWFFDSNLGTGDWTFTLDEAYITTKTGMQLDGEWYGSFSSGNGTPGIDDPVYGPDHFEFDFNIIPGDANRDGMVDGSDVTILAGNWQVGVPGGSTSVTWQMGDFNGDYMVDGSDVTILAGNWQYGVPPAESSSATSSLTSSRSSRSLATLDTVFADYGFTTETTADNAIYGTQEWDNFIDDLFCVIS